MSDCVIFGGCLNKKGYGVVHAGRKQLKAHRVAYCAAHAIPLSAINGVVVRHSCDNPSCVNPEHLSIGTQADNVRDRNLRNRQAKKEAHGISKLTEADAIEIKALYASGSYKQKEIARLFGVNQSQISRVITGLQWL